MLAIYRAEPILFPFSLIFLSSDYLSVFIIMKGSFLVSFDHV